MRVKLKKKYTEGKYYERHSYRARTGPKCCNDNCPAHKKKFWNYKNPKLHK